MYVVVPTAQFNQTTKPTGTDWKRTKVMKCIW